MAVSSSTPRTVLELGSGGGNNASHIKAKFKMTLVDLSEGMLAISESLNPECEHILGDMRTVRLDRLFDAVFIHDAISYMTTEEDLYSTIVTAFLHCKPGGVVMFHPDFTRETFISSTRHGGHDGEGRSLRYLEWNWDPDPADTTYITDFAYLLREEENVRCEYDRHIMGLFGHEDWLSLISRAGFQAQAVPFEHSEAQPGSMFFFGIKPDR